jgi:hypothetical protein
MKFENLRFKNIANLWSIDLLRVAIHLEIFNIGKCSSLNKLNFFISYLLFTYAEMRDWLWHSSKSH